ncbi:Eukaryotic translation initiation factor 3 subunit B [Melia azedarach]|uniref:Eukaryotic translation initiation factor 3 subunit B n=1 Tax=Melia azedarach TaxID=155640 RepID=A0ACC1Z0F9_MELAZ|nr:Eukaryotic translation initiation factor 3 subunit B [Melia azedarach]
MADTIVTTAMEEAQEAAVKLPMQRPLYQQIQINDSDDNDFDVLHEEDDDQSLDKFVVVDNLPVVGPEKFEKLKSVVCRIFNVIKDDMFFMPLDSDTGQSLGYCFIEYNTPQEAELARKNRDGHVMGKVKQYELSVRLFNEFDRIVNVTDEWNPPNTEPNVCKENLQEWLLDYKARDQFLIHTDSELEVSWNDIVQLNPEVVQLLHNENEGLVQWSPLGTYLTTTNKQGVSVWGGAKTFKPLNHYSYQEVELVDFSLAEKYLVTYSSHEPESPQEKYNVVLNIFDIRTGKVKKSFKGSAKDFGISRDKGIPSIAWPLIRWSDDKDDKYFALIGKNAIHVHEREADSFKKCLEVENVKYFSWSPADSVIAIFSPELNSVNRPAKVSLIKLPDKQELRQKSFLNVSDCRMYWQSNGEYLAIKVERYTKTRKSTYSGLELFHMKERDIPIETLELENMEKIIMFAWEPKGQRFAVIHGDNTRPDVSFYSMVNAVNKGHCTKLKTLRDRQVNALYWSPTGCFGVLAGMNGFKGQLEFYDVHNLQTIATTEHYMVTNVEWDPTGRYVATSVTTAHEIENGFNIWSFYGRLLYKIPRDHLFQFSWRPRPPLLLSAEKEEEIKKNLRKYSKKYEVEDNDASMYLNEQEQQRRKIGVEEWNRRMVEWKRLHEEEKDQRRMLRDEEASEEEDKNIGDEVEIEEVLNVVKEIMAF